MVTKFCDFGAKFQKDLKNVWEVTFFGCELSSVNYNGDFTLENDKDLKIKKTVVLECWLILLKIQKNGWAKYIPNFGFK